MKVRTDYMPDFQMPPVCVACGATPVIPGAKKVSLQKNFGGKLITLLVGFPLCNECFVVSQKKSKTGPVIAFGVLLVIALIIISATLSGNNETPIYFILGIVIGAICVALITFWVIRINNKQFTKEELERKTKLTLSVTLANFERSMGNNKGFVEFNFFNNYSFAEEFAKLNHGFTK